MKNPAEQYILYENLSKFVGKDEDEYINRIEQAYKNDFNKSGIIDKLKDRVNELYNVDTMIDKWSKVLHSMQFVNKKERQLSNNSNCSGHELFIISLGQYGNLLKNGSDEDIKKLFNSNLQWKSKSKGSVIQYLQAFPNDLILQKWRKLI